MATRSNHRVVPKNSGSKRAPKNPAGTRLTHQKAKRSGNSKAKK